MTEWHEEWKVDMGVSAHVRDPNGGGEHIDDDPDCYNALPFFCFSIGAYMLSL